MLILALKVQVHGRPKLLSERCPRGAGIKPHVHGVCALDIQVCVGLVRLWEQINLGQLEPSVGALLFHNAPDVLDHVWLEQRLAVLLLVEHRDRNPPSSLSGDAPITATNDHGTHSVDIAIGDESHLFEGTYHIISQPIDAGEPLWRGSSDHRLLASPIVGVLVSVWLLLQQRALLLQQRAHLLISILQHIAAHKALDANIRCVVPGVVQGSCNLEIVFHAHNVIVVAVAWRSVYQACARLGCDVLAAHHHWTGGTQQWVCVLCAFQHASWKLCLHLQRGT
mmetsp:Transcript_70633/g.169259  ORF Transcript_70633/g.169259 Transcript_70633/m.169259 type:complete len:281 (-) Transcript_70633:1307-2149(-)